MEIDATILALAGTTITAAGAAGKMWLDRMKSKDALDANNTDEVMKLKIENTRLQEQLKFLRQGRSRGKPKSKQSHEHN